MAGGYTVKPLAEVPLVPDTGDDAVAWHAIQHHFRLRAFGANAFVAREAGATLVHEHDETVGGHQELYVVLSGTAAFTLDGQEIEAPAGTLVALREPGVRRGAVAREPGTAVLAIGAKPRGEFRSTWRPEWFERVPQV